MFGIPSDGEDLQMMRLKSSSRLVRWREGKGRERAKEHVSRQDKRVSSFYGRKIAPWFQLSAHRGQHHRRFFR